MPKNVDFKINGFYHVANFGIENRLVFNDEKDIHRFINLLDYYSIKNPPARFAFRKRPVVREAKFTPIPMVQIISYSLMPDHFHILLKQLEENGARNYISKVLNSYTKYYNSRQNRKGTLFQGTFKASTVDEDKLTHLSRYIHLEPLLKGLVLNLSRFPFSSYLQYIGQTEGFCEKDYVLQKFNGIDDYKKFMLNRADYDNTLPLIKSITFER